MFIDNFSDYYLTNSQEVIAMYQGQQMNSNAINCFLNHQVEKMLNTPLFTANEIKEILNLKQEDIVYTRDRSFGDSDPFKSVIRIVRPSGNKSIEVAFNKSESLNSIIFKIKDALIQHGFAEPSESDICSFAIATNCPNCGAPMSSNMNCSYCGTIIWRR